MGQSGLVLDDPAPLGDYLACGQFPIFIAPEEAQRRLEHTRPLLENTIDEIKALTGSPPKPVRAIRYNMFGFFKQCVELYCALAEVNVATTKLAVTSALQRWGCEALRRNCKKMSRKHHKFASKSARVFFSGLGTELILSGIGISDENHA